MGTDVKQANRCRIGVHRCSSVARLVLWVSGLALVLAAPAKAENSATPKDYLLHLPGISGYHWVDRQLLAGLRDGGFAGEVEVRDWPGDDPGLAALLARKRNRAEAKRVADLIERRAREHPGDRIVLTAHSGGAGILLWALEGLPKDVTVDTVLLIAPAVSPDYDLTEALGHVRGKVYALSSPLDIVLGPGTRAFGTIDGVNCDAAGRCGFTPPDGADEEQYEKLVQMPYDPKWMRLGNLGDHIGPMGRRFAQEVLAPLVVGESGAAAKGKATSTTARRNTELAPSGKEQQRATSSPAPKTGAGSPRSTSPAPTN